MCGFHAEERGCRSQSLCRCYALIFFFQAEDGIRDVAVTGVQTCALPISQQGLLVQLSQAMSAFYQATQELGVASNVTTFSLSEFSRTFQPGSNAGTDHAWGGHQWSWAARCRGTRSMERCRLWRWAGRTIPAAMEDGFRQRRSTNTQ